MKQLSVRTQVASSAPGSGRGSPLPPGCDLAVLGKIEMHGPRLDGFKLEVLMSGPLDRLLTAEARQTGKTKGEILGYLLDLSLYEKR